MEFDPTQFDQILDKTAKDFIQDHLYSMRFCHLQVYNQRNKEMKGVPEREIFTGLKFHFQPTRSTAYSCFFFWDLDLNPLAAVLPEVSWMNIDGRLKLIEEMDPLDVMEYHMTIRQLMTYRGLLCRGYEHPVGSRDRQYWRDQQEAYMRKIRQRFANEVAV